MNRLVVNTATAQYRGYMSPKQRDITNTGLSHTNVNDRYENSFWRQIKCRETNLKYDCIFVDVLIDLQTRGVRFGNQNEALNVQRNITFKNSILRKLPVTLLDSFRQVEVLDLSNLQIEEIEPFALTNGINIRELNMSFNIIRELPIFAFRNMRFLSVLVLDKNNLTSLPDGMLYGTPNIFDLSIANNNLERIDDNTFKKSKALQFLTISCNKLTHVDLSLVPSLYRVNVSFNLLTMLSVPVAVETLDASHNRINTVTGPYNEELAILLLHHNNLTGTAWIVQYPGLVDVDLSYNEVETITYTHFTDMQRLERLNLSNNRLLEFELGSSPIQSLLVLDLSHNRLLYVDKNQKQFDTLEQLYLDHNSIVVLKLSFTNNLRNLTLSHNDWDCRFVKQLFRDVSKPGLVIGASDRSCKQDYQLVHNLCCNVVQRPYLDRLQVYSFSTSLAEKLQRAEGRCSATTVIANVDNLNKYIIKTDKLLQKATQRDAEINQLQSEILRHIQFEEQLKVLHTEIDNNLHHYRITKDESVHPSMNLHKVYVYLKARQDIEVLETTRRESELLNIKQYGETVALDNINLQHKVTKLKDNIKFLENNIKRKEAMLNRNPLTRPLTK
uniref:APL1B n=1 Tax=Anopheles minimus TaxID=112268 RepID=A0A182WL54_9DIPT